VIRDWAPDRLLLEVRAAEAAATAARGVPGVACLQPGLWGLVRRLAADGFERLSGKALPDVAGVEADLVDGGVRIDVRIVVDAPHQAAVVGGAVRGAVVEAVPAAVGLPVVAAAVHVVGIRPG
jgi:uncharacterized alkaline shock family protein YloU